MSISYWLIPDPWRDLNVPPSNAMAVKIIRKSFEDMGGMGGLMAPPSMPIAYAIASNYAKDAETGRMHWDYLGSLMRRAKGEPEVWDAMVLIIGAAHYGGRFDEAYEEVLCDIGDRPGKPPGRKAKTNEWRDAFIMDWLEILEDWGIPYAFPDLPEVANDPRFQRKRKEAYAILSEVTGMKVDAIRKVAERLSLPAEPCPDDPVR